MDTLPNDISHKKRKTEISFISFRNFRQVVYQAPIFVELNGFAVTSLEANGAYVLLRSQDFNGQIYAALLYSKGKVSLLKTLKIPGLELCTAFILVQLIDKVRNS